MFYEFTKREALRSKIKELCPTAKTVAETYEGEEDQIQILCREFDCSPSDILLTPEEYYELNCYEYR